MTLTQTISRSGVMVRATWFCFAKRMGGNNPD